MFILKNKLKRFQVGLLILIFASVLIYPFLISEQREIETSKVYGQSACDQAQGVGVCHYFDKVGGGIDWGYEASAGRGVLWREIEPNDNDFRFDLLDDFINDIVPAGTKAWLSIQTVGSGSDGKRKAPLWLDSVGAKWFPCMRGIDIGIYAPWDEIYQQQLNEMLNNLSSHIASMPSAYKEKVGGIVIMSGGMYGEMQLWSGDNCLVGGLNLKERLRQDMETRLGTTVNNENFDKNYADAISQIVDIYASGTNLPLMLQLGYQPVDCWVAIEAVKDYGSRVLVKWNGLDPTNAGGGLSGDGIRTKDEVRASNNGYYQELFINLSKVTQVGFEIGHPDLFKSQAQFENVFEWAKSSNASFVCFQDELIPALQGVSSWTTFDSALENTPCSFGGSVADECPDGSFWDPGTPIYINGTEQSWLFSPIPGISLEELLYGESTLNCEEMYEVESRAGHPYQISPPLRDSDLKINKNTGEVYHLYDNAYEAPIGRATDKVEFIAEEVIKHLDSFPGMITQEINQANQLMDLVDKCSIDYCRGNCVGGSGTKTCVGNCETCCGVGWVRVDCGCTDWPCNQIPNLSPPCYCCEQTSCQEGVPPCLTKDDPAVYDYDYQADCVDDPSKNCACPQKDINDKLAEIKRTAKSIMWERFMMQRFFTGRYLPADLYHRQYGLDRVSGLGAYINVPSWVLKMIATVNKEISWTGHSYRFDESFDPMAWLVCFSDKAENCVSMLDLDVNKNLTKSRGVLGGCALRSYEISDEAEQKRKQELLYSCERLLERIRSIHAFVEPVIKTPSPNLEFIIPKPTGIPQEDVCYGNDYCQLRYQKHLEYPAHQTPPEEWPCAEDYYCCQ